MKNATLIAMISVGTIILIDLVQIIASFFEFYSMGLFRVFGILNLIAFVGVLQFFVKLYNKQKE